MGRKTVNLDIPAGHIRPDNLLAYWNIFKVDKANFLLPQLKLMLMVVLKVIITVIISVDPLDLMQIYKTLIHKTAMGPAVELSLRTCSSKSKKLSTNIPCVTWSFVWLDSREDTKTANLLSYFILESMTDQSTCYESYMTKILNGITRIKNIY